MSYSPDSGPHVKMPQKPLASPNGSGFTSFTNDLTRGLGVMGVEVWRWGPGNTPSTGPAHNGDAALQSASSRQSMACCLHCEL